MQRYLIKTNGTNRILDVFARINGRKCLRRDEICFTFNQIINIMHTQRQHNISIWTMKSTMNHSIVSLISVLFFFSFALQRVLTIAVCASHWKWCTWCLSTTFSINIISIYVTIWITSCFTNAQTLVWHDFALQTAQLNDSH